MTFATIISDNIMRMSSAPDVSHHIFQKESEAIFGCKCESKMSTGEREHKESKILWSAIKIELHPPCYIAAVKKPFLRFTTWKLNSPKAQKGCLGPISKLA
jgi:hypothetical protein